MPVVLIQAVKKDVFLRRRHEILESPGFRITRSLRAKTGGHVIATQVGKLHLTEHQIPA
jgi:hypothetical protein